ncbi:MAG: hypothetical protein CM1200mP20_05150 [Pseudomonadota bacterium]|nr:MAG: hypothetical protein CM1200mP20_05150 [Pseudomonadota bacterium]
MITKGIKQLCAEAEALVEKVDRRSSPCPS